MKLAVFDVCGTLYHCNTLFTFMRWRLKRLRLPDSLPVKAVDRLLKPLGIPFRRWMYVRSLRGEDAAAIKESARFFVSSILNHYERPSAMALLRRLKHDGWRVVLLSGAPDFIVREVALQLGIDEYMGSVLEEVNGCLTGRFADITAGRKHELLLHFKPYNDLFVCTDNRNDLELLELAETRRIYCPHRLVRFWKLHGFYMSDLYIDDFERCSRI